MLVYVYINEDYQITGYASTPSKGTRQIDIPKGHDFFNHPRAYKLVGRDVAYNQDYLLPKLKNMKMRELNDACKSYILSGFDHTINGVSYHFSYDNEAQGNFQDAQWVFFKKIVSVINWTVINNDTGEYERIPITAEILNELDLSILIHKNGSIEKLRGELMPKVEEAKTTEELDLITW